MKKLVFLSFVSILSFNAFSQLKIGNNPTTINSNSILELESTNKGLLIPRVALQSSSSASPLSAFVAGMMIYNTATAGDVTPGFYVSTGSNWTKIDNQTSTTLYNGDGTLSGNRTVTQGTNTLAFTSSASTGTSHFTVDGTTLNVDAVNNRIGIGTATPTFPLHVVSTGANAGRFEMNSTNSTVGGVSTIELINTNNLIGNYTSIAGKASAGGFSASMEFVNTNGSHLQPIGDIRFVTNNNGTITEKLRILGNGGIRASSLAGSGSRMVVADGSGNLSTQTIPTSTTYTGSTSVTLNGTSFERAALTGDVTASANSNSTTIANDAVTYAKIQNVSANNTLLGRATTGAGDLEEITLGTGLSLTGTTLNAATATTLYSADGTLAGNRTVTQGANTLAFTSTATNGFSVDGSTFSIDAANNRVGIGTTTPTAKLDVPAGYLRIDSDYALTINQNDVFTHNSKSMTHYGVGWFNDSWDNSGGTSWLSGYAGLKFFSNGATRMVITRGGNVGIGNVAPSERLDVTGNIRFSGALMPNNLAGTSGQVLTSAGAGNVPTWSTLPTVTNYTGSTSVTLNGTSFERAALTGDVTATANSNATTIATGAVTSAKILDGTITAADLNQMSATNGQVLKWNGTAWTPASDEDNSAAVSTLQGQVGTLNTQVQVLNSTVDDLQGQLFSVSDANTLQNSQISSINNTNNLQDDEIANIISTNDTQDSQIAALQSASNTGSTSIALNGTSFERAALTGDVTASANSNATTITNDAVTYAKMQNVSANNTLLGRATTGAGDVEEITLGTGLSLTGTTLNATTANTIYSADGTLSGNRIVTQGTNTLGFSSTASSGTSHFTVDGTTLNVDAVNNRIGVGTATPTFPLHVASSGASAGRFEMNSTNSTVGGVSTIELINTKNLIGNYTSITGKASSGGFSGSMEFVNTNGSHLSPIGDIRFVTNNNGTITEKLRILGNGGIRASSLSGTGSRMVVADASGNLSTQTIPTSTTYTGSTSITLNSASFERAALTGDVTATANSNATTIATDAVTSTKILDGTIATADLADASITAAKLNQMSATTGQVIKWNGTVWAAAADNNTTADGSETRIYGGQNISLSGLGTTASPYTINACSAIATVTSDYTATILNYTILCNVPGAGMTLTLPNAASHTGKTFVIRKIDNDSDAVTFSPALNYSTTQTVSTLNFLKTITVQSNGSGWWIISE